jgi:hypothetical protein
MEHSYMRRRNETRLSVNLLEDRVTPGSLLLSGVNLSPLADLLPRPESNVDLLNVLSVSRVTQDNGGQTGSTGTVQTTHNVTAPVTGLPASTGTTTHTVSQLEAPAPVQQSGGAISQSFHAPSQGGDVGSSFVAPGHSQPQSFTVGNRTVQRAQITPQHTVTPTRVEGSASKAQHTSTSRTQLVNLGGSSSGTKSSVFSTYDAFGSGRADEVLGVATGIGANANTTYSAGYQGRTGSVRHYSSTGAIINPGVNITTPGFRTHITGIAVSPTTGDVYVVGQVQNSNGTQVFSSFVREYDGNLNPVNQGAWITYTDASGEAIRLSRVAVDPSGTQVFVTGQYNNTAFGNGGSYDYLMDNSYNAATLAVNYDQATAGVWDFGADSLGYDVSADATQHYIGQSLFVSPAHQSSWLGFDNNPAGDSFVWGWYASAGAPTDDKENAIWGIHPQPGTTATLQLSGVSTDSVLNGTFRNLVIANANTSDGNFQTYAFVYYITGGDYASHDNVGDALGNNRSGGYALNNGPNNDGDVSEFDSAGNFINFQLMGDNGVSATHGNDIAGYGATSTDVVTGGITTVNPASGFQPTLNGADTVATAVSDGYVVRWTTPI